MMCQSIDDAQFYTNPKLYMIEFNKLLQNKQEINKVVLLINKVKYTKSII